MGKGQPQAGSEDAGYRDRELLRELTRAAHEAAQDARGAIRELAAARAEFDKATEDRMIEFVNPRLRELADLLDRKHGEMQAAIDGAAKDIENIVAKHLGARDYDELLQLVVDKLLPTIKKGVVEATREIITRDLPVNVWNVLTGDNPVSRHIVKSIVTELEHLAREAE